MDGKSKNRFKLTDVTLLVHLLTPSVRKELFHPQGEKVKKLIQPTISYVITVIGGVKLNNLLIKIKMP